MARTNRREAGPNVGNLEHDNTTNAPNGSELRSLIERIERMNEEKKAVQDDIKEIFAESKFKGYDNKIVRIIIRRRAMEKAVRDEQDALVHTYSKAIGDDSPADEE